MSLWRWWRGVQESHRREFDERAQAQQLRAMRDAFIALMVMLLFCSLLSAVALPPEMRRIVLAGLPVGAVAAASVVFFVSAGLRGAFTRRGALIFAGVYLAGAIPAAAILAVVGMDAGTALGLVAGIVFTAVLMVAAAWRNA